MTFISDQLAPRLRSSLVDGITSSIFTGHYMSPEHDTLRDVVRSNNAVAGGIELILIDLS